MSPSLFMLGWMAAVSCLLGTEDRRTVLASVAACLLALAVEAGRLEAGRAEKGRVVVATQALALLAFAARLAAFLLRP